MGIYSTKRRKYIRVALGSASVPRIFASQTPNNGSYNFTLYFAEPWPSLLINCEPNDYINFIMPSMQGKPTSKRKQ